MKLILAEKPELGRAIAEAIPTPGHTDNAVIYKGDYAIAWAYGHLLTLKESEDYNPALKHWSLDALPIYFPDWDHKPDTQSIGRGQGKTQRLVQIGQLLKSSTCVINDGDPDDEGQYLIDEVLRWHRYQGPVFRINTNDTTPAALRRALNHLEDNKLSENRGWSAHARSVVDMMIGYNCSRYFTLKNLGILLTIGWVQTATLGLVVLRDVAIENHEKQKYVEVLAKINPRGVVSEAAYTPKKDDPNLEEGRILDRIYAENKAAMLQDAITYNRSDCQYLSEEQYKEAPDIMQQVM